MSLWCAVYTYRLSFTVLLLASFHSTFNDSPPNQFPSLMSTNIQPKASNFFFKFSPIFGSRSFVAPSICVHCKVNSRIYIVCPTFFPAAYIIGFQFCPFVLATRHQPWRGCILFWKSLIQFFRLCSTKATDINLAPENLKAIRTPGKPLGKVVTL